MSLPGSLPCSDVTVVATVWSGSDAVVLTYKDGEGKLDVTILHRADEASLRQAIYPQAGRSTPPGADF